MHVVAVTKGSEKGRGVIGEIVETGESSCLGVTVVGNEMDGFTG